MKHPLDKFRFCPACGSRRFTIHNIKAKKCADCGFVYYGNAAAATAAFVLNERGELLVCRRAHEPAAGTLDLPGGFVDMDETAEEAIIREIAEELNVQAQTAEYCFSLPNIYHFSGMDVHTLDMFFSCRVLSFASLAAADDVEQVFFVPLAEVEPALFGLESVRRAVEIFLSGR